MIETFTRVAAETIYASESSILATSVELVVILLLCFLLAEREMVRAYDARNPQGRMRVLNVAIAPLLLAFGWIVIKTLAMFVGLVG